MRRPALISATIAPVALIGGWSWAASRQGPGYDPVRDTISALAARAAHDRWIMTAALVVLGLCHFTTAACLTEARLMARLVFAAGGVATIGVAALPQPSSGHAPVATAAFVALAVWPALADLPTRRVGVGVSVLLTILLVWLFIALQSGDLVGLTERALAGAQALWPLGVVLLTWARSALQRSRAA